MDPTALWRATTVAVEVGPCQDLGAMTAFQSKSTPMLLRLALAGAPVWLACSPLKRLDLIADEGTDVTTSAQNESTWRDTDASQPTRLESIPSGAEVSSATPASSETTGGAVFTFDTNDDFEPPPYPACPPDKPYPINGTCFQCYKPGSSQCWPGSSCELARLSCEPQCSSNRDCIFREFSLPVCDLEYRSCRYCTKSFECSPGLICSFGQCIPPPPSSFEDASAQPVQDAEVWPSFDAGSSMPSER